jgi:outer membrane receptor for monomeric catechols
LPKSPRLRTGPDRVLAALASDRRSALRPLRHGVRGLRASTAPQNRHLSSTDNLLSPRVGLVYKPVEPLSLYASYGIAYLPRAGDQLSSLSPTNKAFDPEEFRNYEVGAKWEVVHGLALTAAAYRLERTNVIAPDPSNPAQSILIDGQRVKGVELGLAGNITEAWSCDGWLRLAGRRYSQQHRQARTAAEADRPRCGTATT